MTVEIMCSFCYFYSFFVQKVFTFLYRSIEIFKPTWETFLACLIVSDNLWQVFRCSLITDFIPKMFGFSKVFGCWVIVFDCFTDFVGFFSYKWMIVFISIIFSVNLIANNCRCFFLIIDWKKAVFFRKFDSFIIVFKDKFSDFIDWHLFYSPGNI